MKEALLAWKMNKPRELITVKQRYVGLKMTEKFSTKKLLNTMV